MMQLHIHPDQTVIIRDGNDIVYGDSIENFFLDYGSEPTLFPSSRWNERLYIPSVMNRLCDGFTQETSVDVWEDGDAIIEAADDLIAAKEARLL